MSAPPKLCGFDLLPPQDFHLMVPWVPPGITSHFKRHFPSPKKMSDRRDYVVYIRLHHQTIPSTQDGADCPACSIRRHQDQKTSGKPDLAPRANAL
jgi:hypothetical protein